MSSGRNRSEGWTYAKLSGHKNEQLVRNQFDDENFSKEFSKRLGIGNIVSAEVGGLHEKSVPGVLGRKTKSKTDLKLHLEDGNTIRISIKKSWGGQAAYQTIDSFILGFERQFHVIVDEDIKYLLRLYFYGNPDTEKLLSDPKVTGKQSQDLIDYQVEHNRLVWDSLKEWNKAKADDLLKWFKDNIGLLADYCFSKGLAVDQDEWADYVWFINLLGDDDIDIIYSTESIIKAVEENTDKVVPGPRNGGSTTLLPFGFAQWHHAQIQIHDDLANLLELNIQQL